MREVFGDTSFLIAVTSPEDKHHDEALALLPSLVKVRIVTTDAVLIEFLAFFAEAGAPARKAAAEMSRGMLSQPNTLVLPVTREMLLAGLTLYEARLDKGYSLTDCISMETMRERGCSEVLTADHHFTQAGYQRLLDPPVTAPKRRGRRT
jgi:uncharacterized protein